jgi:hypothetical protein
VSAVSPILDHPLSGPVYFVRGERTDAKTGRAVRTLPKLFVPLTGADGVRIDLRADSAVVNDQLVTTFDNIPDAPVSDFKLDIEGGRHGILVVSGTDICKARQVAKVTVSGKGLAKTSRSVGGATVATLNVGLSKATRSALADHQDVKIKATVAYLPKGAKKATKVTKRLTIHAAGNATKK